MDFIEVEDIKHIGPADPPRTRQQREIDMYEETLKQDEIERDIPEEEREKTIKCLLKAMDYQLKGINEKAKDLDLHNARIDKELKAFEEHLKSEDNRLIMEEIKHKIKKAQDLAR